MRGVLREKESLGELLSLLGYQAVDVEGERDHVLLADGLFAFGLKRFGVLELCTDDKARVAYAVQEDNIGVQRMLGRGSVQMILCDGQRYVLLTVYAMAGKFLVRVGRDEKGAATAEMTVEALYRLRPQPVLPD